jgi:hypothetical protein
VVFLFILTEKFWDNLNLIHCFLYARLETGRIMYGGRPHRSTKLQGQIRQSVIVVQGQTRPSVTYLFFGIGGSKLW